MRSCSVHFGQLQSFPGDFCQWLAGSTITTGYIDHHHHQCCECRLESHFDCSHICKLYVKRRGAIQYRKKNNSQHATDASTSVCSTFASCISTFTASLKPCFLACAQIFVATTKIWVWARKRGACSAVGRTTML